MVFSSSHVQMWELDHKEVWVPKNQFFWIVVLEKTLESLLDCKINSVNLKGDQTWIFIGRTNPEAPILWPPDAKNCLIGKAPDAGKDWRQKEKRAAEDGIDSITGSMDKNLSKLQEIVEDRGAWCAAVHGVEKNETWLSDWTLLPPTHQLLERRICSLISTWWVNASKNGYFKWRMKIIQP